MARGYPKDYRKEPRGLHDDYRRIPGNNIEHQNNPRVSKESSRLDLRARSRELNKISARSENAEACRNQLNSRPTVTETVEIGTNTGQSCNIVNACNLVFDLTADAVIIAASKERVGLRHEGQ